MLELVSEAPRRALAIYAHPDDADISCGGTIAAWCNAGCVVELVVCAKGDKGSDDASVDPKELAVRRVEETDKAAALLGVAAVHRLGRLDGEFDNDLALRAELVAVIRSARPDVVVCPDPEAVVFGEHYYNHRDHRVVGFAALDAVAPAATSPLYFPTAGAAHRVEIVLLSASLEPNVAVDVTSTISRKADAIACHASQIGTTGEWFRPVVHQRAEDEGRLAGVRFAESFRRLRLGS